jgi:hypothetical protein
MGKLTVTEFVSVDGVFEDPGGAEGYEYGGWTFEYDRGEEGDKFKMDELMEADIQLLGRKTYEGFAAAWPTRDGPFADKSAWAAGHPGAMKCVLQGLGESPATSLVPMRRARSPCR